MSNRSSVESGFLDGFSRREFVATSATAVAAATLVGQGGLTQAAEEKTSSEQLVTKLYESLNDKQRARVCFDWNHNDDRGLLRTHVSNNWSITDRRELNVGGSFFNKDQQDMIEALFFGLYNPEWHDRIRKQLMDDAGGYGRQQTIAIFGVPGTEQYEFVMTGRHLTIRCDGNSEEHVAFGGPIFYGHASKGSPDAFNEDAGHPGNVFWPQAVKANNLYQMLDGKQRKQALVQYSPPEDEVSFQGAQGKFPGISIADLSADQKEHAQDVLKTLLEPYRVSDRNEVAKCLEAQGGLDACSLSFYSDDDIGEDGVWDVWRIEGPSFVWHFRGSPHVHVWVNVADDPSVKTNAAG
ncbi:MAG: DUF3500 domain-containing protein [Planctomycetaceae bacterium]|nr:DUF3500 domain-containing protein [Planctomycetaceae bacterium]